MQRNVHDRIFSVVVLLPFLASIAYLHGRKGVALDAFIFGSGSWGIGLIFKLALYHGVVRRLPHNPRTILGVSALNGLVSGVAELGVALAFFTFMPVSSIWDVVGFGVGIGAIEAVLVASSSNLLKGTALEKPADELEATIARLPAGRRLVYGHLLPFIERLIVTGIHIGTRGLVYVAYRSAILLPLAPALGAFLVADGIVGYRLLHEGKLRDLRVLRQTYFTLAVVAVLVLAGFLVFWPDGGYPPSGPRAPGGGR